MGNAKRILTLPLPPITALQEHIAQVREQVMHNIQPAAEQVHEALAVPLLSVQRVEYEE